MSPILFFPLKKYVPVPVARAAAPNACTLLCRWWCFSHYGYRGSTRWGLLGASARSDTTQAHGGSPYEPDRCFIKRASILKHRVAQKVPINKGCIKKPDAPARSGHALVLSSGCGIVTALPTAHHLGFHFTLLPPFLQLLI